MKVYIIWAICLLLLFAWKNVQATTTVQTTNNANNLLSSATAPTDLKGTQASTEQSSAIILTTNSLLTVPSGISSTSSTPATDPQDITTVTTKLNTSLTSNTTPNTKTTTTNTSSTQSATNTSSTQSATNTASTQSATNTSSTQSTTNTSSTQSATNTTRSPSTTFATAAANASTTIDATSITPIQPSTKNTKQSLQPMIHDKSITMSYKLFINIVFNKTLEQKNSEEYNNTCATYQPILQKKFRNETEVIDLIVTVTGFKEGSLIIQYEVFIPSLNTTKTNLTVLDKNLEKAATKWTNYKEKSVGKIDIEKTKKAFNNTFLQTVCSCGIDEYVCVFQNNSPRCEHKCNSTTGISCENNGSCVYDRVSKNAKCLCRNTDNHIFYGENCTLIIPKTTTQDPFPVSKLTIIAISGGTGGALLLIILISSICFCYRLKQAKRNKSFSETSSKCESDIIRDNKKMESIPLEPGKLNPGYRDDRQESERRYPLEQPQTTKSNPLYRDDFGDQRKGYQTDPNRMYQDHDRISRGSHNPQTSNDRPRTESLGNRQPLKHNYYNDSEPFYRDQRESEKSYRPRGFSSERNNPRGRPEEISRERNNSRGWSEESNNDRNNPMGRSEEFNGERNNSRRWPEENSNDRNYPKGRSEESSIGDDRYVYIEGDGGVRRLFKRVDDKELGGETLIYQPSNMHRPIQRENVDSVGDNFIMRPAPPQDNESRRSFYDTIDSESPYKIQRPFIKHNNLYS